MKLGEQPMRAEMQPPKCARCGAQMEEGFIPDTGHGSQGASIWVKGKPDMGFFGAVKTEGKEVHRTRTFRCVQCGSLEWYALGGP